MDDVPQLRAPLDEYPRSQGYALVYDHPQDGPTVVSRHSQWPNVFTARIRWAKQMIPAERWHVWSYFHRRYIEA